MSQVCVDASLALELVLPEPYAETARAQWKAWLRDKVELVAPPLFAFECVSAIRLNVTRKTISADEAESVFRDLLAEIEIVQLPFSFELHERAWDIAKQLKQGQVYDSYYVALAEWLDCEFWTADDKFYLAAHRLYPRVKHISSVKPAR